MGLSDMSKSIHIDEFIYSPTASTPSLQPTLSSVRPLFDPKSTQKRSISSLKVDSASMVTMVIRKMTFKMATEFQLQPLLAMHSLLMLRQIMDKIDSSNTISIKPLAVFFLYLHLMMITNMSFNALILSLVCRS